MRDRIRRGDSYEDCASQPVLCTEVDYASDLIAGISLLTGTVDTCSIENCGVRRLSQDEALDRAAGWERWASERGLMPFEPPKLVDALPTLASDLRDSLARAAEDDLAAGVDEARVHALCACDERGCLGVYLAPEREPCSGRHRVVTADAVISVGVCR